MWTVNSGQMALVDSLQSLEQPYSHPIFAKYGPFQQAEADINPLVGPNAGHKKGQTKRIRLAYGAGIG